MNHTADIVIIGGGVHGAGLAYHLAQAKAGSVVLLEKNALASGPTSKSGAIKEYAGMGEFSGDEMGL